MATERERYDGPLDEVSHDRQIDTGCSKTFLARLCEQAERYDGKSRRFPSVARAS
ncbi:hypothetical protein IQ07DRAFT_585192 [Pyrenochaeta sp. DS3sAY3a]|nr:hypothetical protein IQ07DRAFT_585192 [Pyrenochaeta sp. DS3sAY3a]